MKETELERLIHSYNERMKTKELLEDVIDKIVEEITVASEKVSIKDALYGHSKMAESKPKQELLSQLIRRWKNAI